MPDNSSTLTDCYARFDQEQLVVGNQLIQRTWIVQNGRLLAQIFLDKSSGQQWLVNTASHGSLTFQGDASIASPTLTTICHSGGPVGLPYLCAQIKIGGLIWEFRINSQSKGVQMRLIADQVAPMAASAVATSSSQASGIEQDCPASSSLTSADLPDVLECLQINPLHLLFTQVNLKDQTDIHNNLVHEQQWQLHPNEKSIAVQGNLFWLEDKLSQQGLIYLKMAPLPHARQNRCAVDAQVKSDGQICFFGHGLDDSGGEGYAGVLLSYQNGRCGRTRCAISGCSASMSIRFACAWSCSIILATSRFTKMIRWPPANIRRIICLLQSCSPVPMSWKLLADQVLGYAAFSA